MIIPEYWAEARRQVRDRGRSITVRRFGWSDDGEEAAQSHAAARVEEALAAILAGSDLPRRERVHRYGAEGLPIREQVVARHGDAVVTRNSYGALCLNTPDVLFGDVDCELPPSGMVLPVGVWGSLWLLVALGLGFGWNAVGGVVVATFVVWALNAAVRAARRRAFDRDGGAQARAMARVEAFSRANPDWHLRVYRTPAGLRVLAMHATFAPTDERLDGFFRALAVDGLYASMCRVQQCFRARLSPKPWRIGMKARIRPPGAAWSRSQANLPARLAWIAEYERRSAGYAACRYLCSLGRVSQVDPRADAVRALHDEGTRAGSGLPLA